MGRSRGTTTAIPLETMQVQPEDLHAERALLGACMLDGDRIDDVAEIVAPRHFANPRHEQAFELLLRMRQQGIATDAVTVASQAAKAGILSEIGGPAFLVELMEAVPFAHHAKWYADQVRAAGRKRFGISAAIALAESLNRHGADVDESLAAAEQRIHAVLDDGVVNGPGEIGGILAAAMADIETGGCAKRMIPVGWTRTDEISGGLPCGGVTILAARPSAGKTAMACSLALRIAEAGVPVLLSSWEQRRIELSERLLAIHSGVSFYKLTRNLLNPDERNRVRDSLTLMQALPIALDDSMPGQVRLQSVLRLQCRRKKTRVAILDYLQLIDPEDRKSPREQQVASVSRAIKRTAMETGLACVVLSQLNRDVEKRDHKRPRLSDLRESGSIEQDADQVWLLHRPHIDQQSDGKSEPLPDNVGVVEVAKNRNGPTGAIRFDWTASTMTYRESTAEDGCGADQIAAQIEEAWR